MQAGSPGHKVLRAAPLGVHIAATRRLTQRLAPTRVQPHGARAQPESPYHSGRTCRLEVVRDGESNHRASAHHFDAGPCVQIADHCNRDQYRQLPRLLLQLAILRRTYMLVVHSLTSGYIISIYPQVSCSKSSTHIDHRSDHMGQVDKRSEYLLKSTPGDLIEVGALASYEDAPPLRWWVKPHLPSSPKRVRVAGEWVEWQWGELTDREAERHEAPRWIARSPLKAFMDLAGSDGEAVAAFIRTWGPLEYRTNNLCVRLPLPQQDLTFRDRIREIAA